VNRPDRILIRTPWPVADQKCAAFNIELRLEEQLCERGVSLIGTAVIQAYLRKAG
jgi:hypothetical protein